MYLQNEEKHMDLVEWLVTLEELGVNVAKAFPAVLAANERIDTLEAIRQQHTSTEPDLASFARRIGLTAELDNPDTVLADVAQVAYNQDEEHRQRVGELLERAADTAKGEAIRRFRRSDVLAAITPTFDTIAARIVASTDTITTSVFNLEDAARLGYADSYLQLERDLTTWKQIADLIGVWRTQGVLPDQGGYTVAYMVNDADAYREAAAGTARPSRQAAGITAGVPHLHLPEPTPFEALNDRLTERAAREANHDDHTARADLGLTTTR